MLQLILSFYIPAFLISVIVVAVVSIFYLAVMTARPRHLDAGQRREVYFDLLVTDLLVVPVFSFAVLAVLVILRAH